MKKSLIMAAVAALAFTSCTSIQRTASVERVSTELYSRSSADLKVSDKRVSYTLVPSKSECRGGLGSVKNAAVAALLAANGNADVLVAPEFEIKRRSTGKIKSVIVSGRPATYVNVHPVTKGEAEVITLVNGAR